MRTAAVAAMAVLAAALSGCAGASAEDREACGTFDEAVRDLSPAPGEMSLIAAALGTRMASVTATTEELSAAMGDVSDNADEGGTDHLAASIETVYGLCADIGVDFDNA